MKKMQIFEPAMCCPTGICGVGVDPELLRMSTVLNTLGKNGAEVERFNLSDNPQAFVTNKVVNNYIRQMGVDGLPMVVLDGEIVITGRYPSNDEFTKLLGISADLLKKATKAEDNRETKAGECDCSSGCCC
ncbi:MAG: arsenite efflux transporter metallochaperone ArsD [Anaerolineaceae bacterium]|nr:MAG: arsenite efflux transporter metallochaperone ArsD [Anaerolineaceae bacterium]